jgi:Holliday junction resolvase RusA-like endonuclease
MTGRKKTHDPKPPATKKTFEFHVVTPEERLPDGALLLQFTIPGRPITKKTHQRVVKRGRFVRILPSEQYERYEKACKPHCEAVWRNLGKEPIDFGVSVCMKVVVDNWTIGDVTGYQQSIGDIIEKHGIIADDMWIHWTDEDTHAILFPDKENPRVEITIRRFRHPKESYRAEQEETQRRRLARKTAKHQGENPE